MIRAAITGISAYVPEDILTNDDLAVMVDTSDEWITTRVGIKERHILKKKSKGTSFMGAKAVKDLLLKTHTKPEEVEVLIFATTTPDYLFPSTAALTAEACGIKNALGFDIQAACSGFIYALEIGSNFIKSEKYKKVIIVAGDKMSSITNYKDRSTCPLFGDAVGAIMLEPSANGMGIMDTILHIDGIGIPYLHLHGGGSANPASYETIDNDMHYLYQEGKVVYKHAVSYMTSVSEEIMVKNNLSKEDVDWFIPHQANIRIINAVGERLGIAEQKTVINIERYGNTSSGTIPLCLYESEERIKKGDNIILTAFGAGFTWGAIYLKWAY